MVATIAQVIGKINPIAYAANGRELLKKYGSRDNIPAEEVEEKPASEHNLFYDSSSETLEPIYFFILDLLNDFGLAPEKLVDNFSSSPGSGHFGELGGRATAMQQQGSKILVDINAVLRSVLNIIYDLKEFRLRLGHYDSLRTKDSEAAVLALKQIWLDKVDIQKGNSSVKAMALGQAGFQTLLDSFLVVRNVNDVDKVDLNDRVKRILRPRILEFNHWLEQSEKELRRRYELEKNYLESQVSSLKLYSRWVKPYLRAAQELEMKARGREPALVTTFNTILLELTLLGKKKLKVNEEALSGNLPKEFEKMNVKRDYHSCVLVDFRFRGIPQKVAQQSHYAFGGRSEITFKSYVLNDDELKKLNEELDTSDVGDVLRLIEGSTGESLSQIQEEIDFFLNEPSISESAKKPSDTSNPFKALVGGYDEKKEEVPMKVKRQDKKPAGKIIIKPDAFIEREYLRTLAAEKAKNLAFEFFDVYKKAHGMASYT